MSVPESNPGIQEVRVFAKDPRNDILGRKTFESLRRSPAGQALETVETKIIYLLEGPSSEQAAFLAQEVLAHPVTQDYTSSHVPDHGVHPRVRIGYHLGMTDPKEGTLKKVAGLYGVPLQAAAVDIEYQLKGASAEQAILLARQLYNPTVEEVRQASPKTLKIEGQAKPVQIIPVRELSPDELAQMSKDMALYLSTPQMQAWQEYYKKLGRDATDVELKYAGGAWSDHCKHITFNSTIETANGERKPSMFKRIKEAALSIEREGLLSAFEDNAGVVVFYNGFAISMKGETHISPSALHPKGGAATGAGGLFRDLNENGQGGHPFLCFDIFAVAPPDLDPAKLPSGCLPPEVILKGIGEGVENYGNPMGIPTRNGSISFGEQFKAKPTVLVVGYGLTKEEYAKKGQPQTGDLVVAIGARTGIDGIGGATFSSVAMDSDTATLHGSAVQIGDPIEEKRMFDAIIAARDKGLIRALTDCGAAGFASAVGEMGSKTGVLLDLSKVPTKYEGMSSWQKFISESQERGVAAIAPEYIEEFLKTCAIYNTESTVIGHFTDNHKLVVTEGDQVVADLEYDFIENGLPDQVLKADWQKLERDEALPGQPIDWKASIFGVLSHLDVCSKQPLHRRYDWGVQGKDALSPYTGVYMDCPNDASVQTPILGEKFGWVASHGINPRLAQIDPYEAAIYTTTQAIAHVVAAGGNPREVWLKNNYVSGKTDDPKIAGALDQCVDGVCNSMIIYNAPVISGKDSCSSTFKNPDGTTESVIPYVVMSAGCKIPDVEKTISADIKDTNSILCVVGKVDQNLGGSVYYDLHGALGESIPQASRTLTPRVFEALSQAIQSGDIKACKAVGKGGVVATLSQMCFGGDCGASIIADTDMSPEVALFNETPGTFVVEIATAEDAKKLLKDVPYKILGVTTPDKTLKIANIENNVVVIDMDELKQAWKKPLERIFA